MARRPASKAYRDQQRERLARLGVDGSQLIEQLVVDLMRHGYRPREAWRLAREITHDEAAAQFNQIRGDRDTRMRGSRILEYEKWPTGGVRPSARALKILAAVYDTTWDRLVDIDDLEAMPPRDRQELLDDPAGNASSSTNLGSVSVAVYLDTNDSEVANDVFSRVEELMSFIGYAAQNDAHVERGSIFRTSWAKLKILFSADELRTRLTKVERALELVAIDERQAAVDLIESQVVENLMEALNDVPEACVRIGSLLLVKTHSPKGIAVFARTLSQLEVRTLEKYPEIQKTPGCVLELLAAAIEEND